MADTDEVFNNVHRNASEIIWALARHMYEITQIIAPTIWIGRGWDDKSEEHSTGRALDLMVASASNQIPRPDQKAAGELVVAWLLRHADELHVQHILWDEKIWRARDKQWGPLPNRTPESSNSSWHRDHIHVLLLDAKGIVPDEPLIPFEQVLKEDNMATAQELSDAFMATLITANGKTQSFKQHLAELFVDTDAQSLAAAAEASRDGRHLDYVEKRIKDVEKALVEIKGMLEAKQPPQ